MPESQRQAENSNKPQAGDHASSADADSQGHGRLPSISLPKGGGALKGIGEKFAANPVTGTGSLSVPIFTTPGRSTFSPQLSLAYDSGAGNGPFGFGWHLSVPAITRKTDKGLPRYQDDDASDVYILSEAEDLVPALMQNGGTWPKETFPGTWNGEAYTVQRYRLRVEGLFARIERWRNNTTGDMHWKTVSKDNMTSLYGQSAKSRIADPDDPSRVFTWLLDLSYDDTGNVIVYEYTAEDQRNVAPSLHEQNRIVTANRYLKHISYGHETAYDPAHNPTPPDDWQFQVVFDYGEHDQHTPRIDDDKTNHWLSREDAFSSYRAGFEVRTYRLCSRVLMFHQFAELGATPCLVRSTDFTYNKGSVASFLTAVAQTGFIRNPQDGTYELTDSRTGKILSPQALPQLECTYSEVKVDDTLHFVDEASLENLPAGVDGAQYQWIDLDSEGLPGVLTEQADAWFYKRNVSNLPRDGNGIAAHFEAMELIGTKPSLAALQSGQQHLMDLAGDGQLCLVEFSQPISGFSERNADGQWQSFTPFAFSPSIEWNNPNLKFIDLDGDGHADILITEDEIFTWYPSRAKEGFGAADTVRKPFDEDQGPALVFADGTQSIYVADFSGDGLTDLVRIRNGEVCYWPNLGYGRFGAKITMDSAPWFDFPDQFDQKRMRLADIDGSGTTDIIYLGRDKVRFWFNQSGNSWSEAHELSQFPVADDLTSVTVLDLLGNGTACIVWSSPLPGDVRQPMRYVDLMGGQKPHLLISTKNNLGAETKVQYAASTKFYLQDRAAGNPWITRLPFPVHVIERVETYDDVSKTKFVTLYKYHHGYFDGVEREFRGFGMVEQWDTESFAKYAGVGLFTEAPDVEGEEFHLPPVHTKTWFHTGAFIGWDNISKHYLQEHYGGDARARPWEDARIIFLPDTAIPDGLTADEAREACRALKGSMLRQEIYAEDNAPSSRHPYSATEHTYHLRLIQPRQGNRHAVFYANESETLAYHYERNPDDPRITHELTMEIDEFGNVLTAVSIGYSRRTPAFDEQKQTLITYTENRVANKPAETDWYRIGVPIETRTYELTGFAPSSGAVFSLADFIQPNLPDVELRYDRDIDYEQKPTGGRERRLIEHVRSLYYRNDLSGSSPLGEVESLALPYENYKLAFTPGLLTQVYSNKITNPALATLLSTDGKHQDLDGDGHWWIPSGRVFFSPDPINPAPTFARSHFYLPQGALDPFGNLTRVTWDDPHNLLPVQTEDAVHNLVVAQNDYRVMQPALVTDPNNNRTAVAFDALGLVIATAVMGKQSQNEGDTLDDPTTRLEYDLFNWQNHQQPNFVHTFAREQHGAANPRWQESYSYADGMGREVMKKMQAEPGLAPARDANGALQHDASGTLIFAATNTRWVGTGRTVFDNKGNPIKKYEPFFDSTPVYEDEKELVEWGVTPILRYDPLGRLIRTDAPNGTFSTVEFDAWQQITADENDTVRQSQWYAKRGSPGPAAAEPSDAETRAAWLAAKHAGTPTVAHLDTLGRTFLTIADNAADGKYETRIELDIEGNQRSITDALNRKVMTYDYDMLSTKIHSVSVDAGERWMLNNVTGKPLRAWDSRDHQMSREYDPLQRPTNLYVQTGTAAKRLTEQVVYGEGQPKDQDLNLRGNVFQQLDGAGRVTNDQFDFKGNLLSSTRQVLQNYRDEVDWSQSPALESESFTSSTTYDGLNRPVTLTTPDASVIRPIYNEANLLEKMIVSLRGAPEAPFITNIDYSAKGQRELIEYANGAKTTYAYDQETFRLIHIKTTRPAGLNGLASQLFVTPATLQDLSYTYDPVGNITHIADGAISVIIHDSQQVEPVSRYTYDAIYRLTSATGREHLAQSAFDFNPPDSNYRDYPFWGTRAHPNDLQALRNYAETYQYDEVGNIRAVMHTANNNGNWTRTYAYDEPNPAPTNNRLSSTTVGSVKEQYAYDAHGNMARMQHLPTMEWDYKDQLYVTQQQVVNNGPGEKTYYVYDAAGQRVRKITETANGTKKKERIYLGGFEVYREYDGSGAVALERETLHVMDDKRRVALVETKTIDMSVAPNTVPETATRYQFDNHLGSVCLELDGNAAVISYEEYYPYGSTSYQAGRSAAEVSFKRYRYTGKERDEETGLYYHGARYYAPWLGRWASCDPITTRDEANLYPFVKNRPLSLVDRDGKQPEGGFEPPPVVRPPLPSPAPPSPVSAPSAGEVIFPRPSPSGPPLSFGTSASAPKLDPVYAPGPKFNYPFVLPPPPGAAPQVAPSAPIQGGPVVDPQTYTSKIEAPPFESDTKYLELAKKGHFVSHAEITPKGAVVYLELGKYGFAQHLKEQILNKYDVANYLIRSGVVDARAHASVEYSSRLSQSFAAHQLGTDFNFRTQEAYELLKYQSEVLKGGWFDPRTKFVSVNKYFGGLQVDEFVSRFLGGPQTIENQGFIDSRVNAILGPVEYWAAKDLPAGTKILQFKVSFRGSVAPSYKGVEW